MLRIRDPILRPDLAVEAAVEGRDGTRTTIWMLLDSGATIGSLPAHVAADLHLAEERRATMIAINGLARTSVVVAPRLAQRSAPSACTQLTSSSAPPNWRSNAAIDPSAPGFSHATFRHLLVGLKSPSPGKTYLELADPGRVRVSPDALPCRELTVLDVAPARPGRDTRGEAYARLVR